MLIAAIMTIAMVLYASIVMGSRGKSLTGELPAEFSLLNLFPVIPAFADLLEDYFENALTISSVRIASNTTRIKWIFSMMNYILIISGVLLLVLTIVKQRRK